MASTDDFKFTPNTPTASARGASAVTPVDGTSLTRLPKALYVGVGGDVAVILADDTVSVVLKSVPTGALLPIRPTTILATGTTATNIIALY